MKFIHTSDIHYGMNPDVGRPWSKERSNAIKEALQNIVSACKQHSVDCLFISGDLFHRQALIKDLKEINYLFGSIKDVRIIIIAGNHDYIKKGSILDSFSWSENVYFIKTPDISSIYFRELNTEVFGFSYYASELRENKLAGLKAPANGRINILMAHGGGLKHLPFDKNALVKSGFSYCALGHIHKHEILYPNTIVYPGSPEPLDVSETGAHGFCLGEINPVTKALTRFEFVPCASLSYIPLVIGITPETTNTELLMRIANEVNQRGTNNIYRLKIKGLRDPDIEFDLDVLRSRFKIYDIIDNSEPNYDFSKLFAEHSADMLGFFINELYKPDISDIDKKALFYGVDALLKTSDERS